MAQFGKKSKATLATCDISIQAVLQEAIKEYDFSVIWGYRDKETQNRVFEEGNSQLQWPRSKHNRLPSAACDIIPYPDGFGANTAEFYRMATYVLAAASRIGVSIKWGGHWKDFQDLAHFELR